MNSTLQIKVCGMRDIDNIFAVAALKPDWMGFIFHAPSPRAFPSDFLPEWMMEIEPAIRKVGVFVNENESNIHERIERFNLNAVQLHGKESVEYCSNLKMCYPNIQIWKVFHVDESLKIEDIQAYEQCSDMYLFDTACNHHGGSGLSFDWKFFEDYKGETPFLVAGGLDLIHVKGLKELKESNPAMLGIDLNSRFEVTAGMKSVEKLRTMFEEIRR